MKKFVNYLQILVAINFVTIAVITIIRFFTPNPDAYLPMWEVLIRFGTVINMTYLAGILLREIPYLRTKHDDDSTAGYIISGVIAGIIAAIFCFAEYGPGSQIPVSAGEFLVFGAPIYLIIVSLIHPRYALASLFIMDAIQAFWSGARIDLYFIILGWLMLAALIGFVAKLIFFTRWSHHVKEKGIEIL